LTELIERGALRIVPDKARSEVLATLRGGLEDFSVSRSLARARGWGVPVPGDPSQMVYVWFDALASYLTALGWPSEGEIYRRHWRDAEERVHVIGKGITKFHALHWPAMLLSAGLPLPTTLVVHGYLTVEGRKIGKSLGNAVAPAGLVERYGRDALRYGLLRHVRPHEDADFRVEAFERALESELADQLGNWLQRTLALVERGLDGRRPTRREDGGALAEETASLEAEVRRHVAEVRCDRALEAIFRRVESGNRFLEARAPWRLIPKGGVAATGSTRDAVEGILGTSFAALDAVGRALRPFLPETAEAIRTRLRGDDSGRCRPGAPLFQKRRPHVA
jgi:methionyl-tRNA synthetase